MPNSVIRVETAEKYSSPGRLVLSVYTLWILDILLVISADAVRRVYVLTSSKYTTSRIRRNLKTYHLMTFDYRYCITSLENYAFVHDDANPIELQYTHRVGCVLQEIDRRCFRGIIWLKNFASDLLFST